MIALAIIKKNNQFQCRNFLRHPWIDILTSIGTYCLDAGAFRTKVK